MPQNVRIDFARSGRRGLLIGVPVSGALFVLAGLAALFPDRYLVGADQPGTRVMAWLCTALFFIPVLLLLVGWRRMIRQHGLVVDQQGIWRYDGDDFTLIDWREFRAVGVAYKVSPAPRTSHNLIRTRQGFALEFYPAQVALDDRLPDLRRVEEQPPHPQLPPVRYRLMLPPYGAVPAQLEQAVRTFAPHHWAGSYQRQWHPMPGS